MFLIRINLVKNNFINICIDRINWISLKFKVERKYFDFVIVIMVLILSCIPLFYDLSGLHIRMWDEAFYANNSIEMMTNCNLLVVQHEGKPDLFNTKPPFVIWLQALSMNFFGINELAVRLPSAIFGLFTVIIVYLFCATVIKSKITGLFSVLILVSSRGFVGYHVTRTGDLDGVLVFWLTFYSLLFIRMLVYPSRNIKFYFSLLSIGIICAFLTKGIAGFFFLPSLLLISLLFGNHSIYKHKILYVNAFISLTICMGYYVIRELLLPGYLEIVINFEIFRIKDVVASWQVHPIDFYILNIVKKFSPFYYVLPYTIFIPFLFKYKSNEFKISIYLLILSVGYLVLISYPPVKLEWYDAPMYPLMAILIGLITDKLIKLLSKIVKSNFSIKLRYALILITLLAIFIYPYRKIFDSFKSPENIYVMEMDGAYLKYLKTNFPEINKLKVFKIEKHIRHYDQVLFYKKAYEKQNDYEINISSDSSFNNGDYVLAVKNELKSIINNNYSVQEINKWKSGTLYKIISRKSQ